MTNTQSNTNEAPKTPGQSAPAEKPQQNQGDQQPKQGEQQK